jgi:hypothetical protein
VRLKFVGAPPCINQLATRNCKGTSRSNQARYLASIIPKIPETHTPPTALVIGMEQSADPQLQQPKRLFRMWFDDLPVEWCVDLHVPGYAVMEIKNSIPCKHCVISEQ